MRLGVYAIRDLTTGEYLGLTQHQNNEVAKRTFESALMQPGTVMNTHGDQFTLEKLGEFDTKTGELKELKVEIVMRGSQRYGKMENNVQ